MSTRRALAIAALCLLPLTAQPATPMATVHGSGVSIVMPASCAASATWIEFGNYTGTLAVATATIKVICTRTTPYTIGLNAGTSSGATVTTRRMTDPDGGKLAYWLFRDKARTVNWGETVSVDTHGGLGSGSAQTLNVYAAVSAGQKRLPGPFTDTVTVTVRY